MKKGVNKIGGSVVQAIGKVNTSIGFSSAIKQKNLVPIGGSITGGNKSGGDLVQGVANTAGTVTGNSSFINSSLEKFNNNSLKDDNAQ